MLRETDMHDQLAELRRRHFYVELVNAEFSKQLKTPIDPSALNAKQPRVLRAIEEWLNANPLTSGKFGHYRPARYFAENVTALWPKVSDKTKDRSEAAFKHLNGLLK
jgi:hypothetical protein